MLLNISFTASYHLIKYDLKNKKVLASLIFPPQSFSNCLKNHQVNGKFVSKYVYLFIMINLFLLAKKLKSNLSLCILGLFLLLGHTLMAQAPKVHYPFKKQLIEKIEADTVPWKYQVAAAEYTFIGAYREALQAWDLAVPSRPYVVQERDTALLRNVQPYSAQQYILEEADKHSMVIINEAHHQPMHRIFTQQLLRGLYEKGYRYLGLEALDDPEINTRGFATENSGYYTLEPSFGAMIAEAIALGFEVFGYEAPFTANGTEREIHQAKSIQQFLANKPKGKVLIHCGFDHVYEGEVAQWGKAMAGRIKEYMGIDPLTIDQVRYTERGQTEWSHYYVQHIPYPEAFVLKNDKGEIFRGPIQREQTDLVVIHPLSSFQAGRPTWSIKGKHAITLPQAHWKHYKAPVQIFAYRLGEYLKKGIPVDLIEWDPSLAPPVLYAPQGKYHIVVKNEQQQLVDQFEIAN
jgi:hypothetical protein